MLVTPPLALATLVVSATAAADVAIFLTTGTWAHTCYLDNLVPVGATHPSVAIAADLGPSDEKCARFNGTDPAIYHQHSVVESATASTIDIDVIAWMESTNYGESAAMSTRIPSAIRASRWSPPTAATQSSAGRRRAQPPALKPPTGGYAGVVVMTGLMCLVAFGIGSILGWIWPDGLRSDW
ncbi:hypothetical protein LY78DRAFT_740360 [Colletotrichum sublineola]|nr:hypothetical protein LY78DRAFT_740360 [Colletotrichum sublineola]